MSNVKCQSQPKAGPPWAENVKPGFTRIELAIVTGITLLLLIFVVIAIKTTSAEARDSKRLSDMRQMSAIIDAQYIETPNESLSGCDSLYALTTQCTGPGKISQFSAIEDPSLSKEPCYGKAAGRMSQGVCAYSISKINGEPEATTDNYQLCFFLERGMGVKGFSQGLYHIETGGILKEGCN